MDHGLFLGPITDTKVPDGAYFQHGDLKELVGLFMPHLIERIAQQLQFLWQHLFLMRTGASSDLGRCWNNIRN